MLGYLSKDIICSEKPTVFRDRSSRKSVNFEEQIMSKDKYPTIFLLKMEATFKSFSQRAQFSRMFPSWEIFGHVTRLDQSCASENISWIIIYNNYSMSPSWIWNDKRTNERVARVGYNHFISNKGEWNNCFNKFSNRVLPPIFISRAEVENFVRKIFKLGALFSIWRKTPTIGS